MPIETECPGCGRRLQVGEEHAEQQARCPVCHTIYLVPKPTAAGGPPSDAAAESGSNADPDVTPQSSASRVGQGPGLWRMRTPEGQLYGPVAKTELDRWVSEGRVTADCELMEDDSHSWQTAETFYSVLRSPAKPSPTETTRYRYTAPHRGALVLTLGILGWVVCCPLFGIIAWAMGSSDLRDMRAGRMDPSGHGSTHAGLVLGMVNALLLVVFAIVVVFVALARLAIR